MPTVIPPRPVPVLVRLGAAAMLDDAFETADVRRDPRLTLCGLAPEASRLRNVAPALNVDVPGGSGRGRGTEMVLWRLIGDPSRAGTRVGKVVF